MEGAYDDVATLRELVFEGYDIKGAAREVSERTGRRRTYHAVRLKAAEEGIRFGLSAPVSRVIRSDDEIALVASEWSAKEEAEEIYRRAVARTDRALSRAKEEGVAYIQIVSSKPVLLSISSDWHISTTGATDIAGLRDYAQAIASTPGAWAVAAGDQIDNPIKWSKNMTEVPDEYALLGMVLNDFGSKLLGMTSGNHDDWTVAFSGIDALRWLVEKGKLHYAPDELVYIIEILDPATGERTARYCVATRHKYYRHSNLNPTHGCFRWLEDRVGQWPVMEDGGELVPDILAMGHNHVAACEVRSFVNKPIWGARMGAWQYTSAHGRAGGWRNSPPTAPNFILFPHRARDIEGFADYRNALDSLARHRAEWS